MLDSGAAWVRYAAAAGLSLAALAAGMLLEPYIDPNYFSLFVAAIALAAWVGGRGPGWLAIVLGTLLLNLVLLDRDDLVSVGRLVRTGAFFVAIVLVVEFVGSRRSAAIRWRYDQAQDELRVRQTAEQQLMLLLGLAGDLSRALSISEIVDVVLVRGVPAVSAQGGSVTLISGDGETFQIAGSSGMPESLVQRWHRYPRVGQFPLSKVAETGEPVWIESADTWREMFPDTIADFEASGYGSMASLPLMFEGRLLGGLSFDFRDARAFDADDRGFMQAVAHQTALALERARLFELERASREEAASAEARYRGLFEGSGDAVFVLDARGRIVDVNAAAASLTDRDRADCVGREFESLWSAETVSLAPEWSEIDEHGVWEGEHQLKRGDGSAVPVETRAVAVDTPNERLILASSREVTRRKMMEQAQQALFASVSHDLKSPLAAISLQAQMIRRNSPRQDNVASPELDPRVDVILAAAQRMNAIIDELVEVAQLRLGHPLRLNYSQVDLVDLAQRCIEQLRESTTEHTLVLQADEGSIIGFWDAGRMDRVFDNLISNAIKYSPGGGRITVRLSRQRDDAGDDWAVIEVADEGIGIPATDLPHIFEHYRRGANVQDRIVGSGIGLAGVRQVVEQHGGTAIVRSKEGRGTTIRLRLPVGTRKLLRVAS